MDRLNSLKDVYFSGFVVCVFGKNNIDGKVVKRFLQFLSVIGIALLATDMGLREPPRYLTTSAVAVHRGSMQLAYCIMFYSDIKRASSTKRASNNTKMWISLGIRAVCEFLAFGLSFLSFHEGLASPLNYKLVRYLCSGYSTCLFICQSCSFQTDFLLLSVLCMALRVLVLCMFLYKPGIIAWARWRKELGENKRTMFHFQPCQK